MTDQWLPRIDAGKCAGCGDCIAACPEQVLGERNGKAVLLHPDACTYCGVCENVCPFHAIQLPYLIVRFNQDGGQSNA